MSSREGDAGNFTSFMAANQTLLKCYASQGMTPAMYKSLDPATQRDFCYTERAQLEDQLFKQKIRP